MDERVFEILEAQSERIKKAKGFKPSTGRGRKKFKPFFHALEVKNVQDVSIATRDGGTILLNASKRPNYSGRLEMRMGHPEEGCNSETITFDLPHDLGRDASFRELWVQSNECFWKTVDAYSEMIDLKSGKHMKRHDFFYHAPATPVVKNYPGKDFKVDLQEMEGRLKAVSAHLSSKRGVVFSHADLHAYREEKYFVNSEGSRVFEDFVRFGFSVDVYVLDEENDLLVPMDWVHQGINLDKIPSLDEMIEQGELALEDARATIKAPFQENDALPAILDGENHGVLWHEVVGHSLEADSMQANCHGDVESGIFYGRMGDMVAPPFISLHDDPTLEDLDGHYLVDADGVLAQKVTLLEDGKLINLLHSRETGGYFRVPSNGHARADSNNVPQPRMSNLRIISSQGVPYKQLQEKLLEVVEQDGKKYGLSMKKFQGGFTLPRDAMFGAFPKQVFRVYPSGKLERVRNTYMVGTPHKALQSIMMTGNEYAISNGSCRSDSGDVPVTEYAPNVLLRSLEVNRIPNEIFMDFYINALSKPRFGK